MKKVYNKDDLYNGFAFRCVNEDSYIISNLKDSCTLTNIKTKSQLKNYGLNIIIEQLNQKKWVQVQTELEYEIC